MYNSLIMTTQTATFTFSDQMNWHNTTKCLVTITVKKIISNDSNVYDITFKYKYKISDKITDAINIKAPHPFAYCGKSMRELADGEIVIKNSMTTEMVKYMMMNDDELCKHIGLSTPQHYRTMTMINLMRLWD